MRRKIFLLSVAALGILITACGGQGAPDSDPVMFSVSGTVQDNDGNPLSGVTVGFGSAASSISTDSSGAWSKSDLTGEVTVTPSHNDYAFIPENITVTTGASDVDFVGHEYFSLAGNIMDENLDAFAGVTVTLILADQELETTTDADGNWEYDGLYGTVTVVPEKLPYGFSPHEPEYTAAANDVNFTTELLRCTSGNPTLAHDPCVLKNVEQLQLMQDILVGHFALGGDIDALGNNNVDGLVGHNGNTPEVEHSYALGAVTGANHVGGLVGTTNSPIVSSFSTGAVSGANDVGGLIGSITSNGAAVDSYWDEEVSGQQTSAGGGAGKTTAEMHEQATFAGWDFTGVWTINEGSDYPDLIDNPR